MNAEMHRTWRLLRDVLPARVVAGIGALLLVGGALAWPLPGLLFQVHVSPLEFVPTLLLGGVGVVALFSGGSRMLRGDEVHADGHTEHDDPVEAAQPAKSGHESQPKAGADQYQGASMRHLVLITTLFCLASAAGAASLTAAELRSMAGRHALPALEAGDTVSVSNDFTACVKEMVEMAESAMEWGYPVQPVVASAEERRTVLWIGQGALVLACKATEQRAEATFLRYAAAGAPQAPVWGEKWQGEEE